MIMKTFVYLILFACIALPLQAQYFSITKLAGTDTGIQFPYFLRSADTFISKRINTTLFLSELEILPKDTPNNIDEVVGLNKDGFGKNAISYHVYRNDEKLLSVVFHNSASGLTTYYWSSYYTFNAQNGSLIPLKDLIAPNKYAQFIKLVEGKGRLHILQQIPEMDHGIDTVEMQQMTEEVSACFNNVVFENYFVNGDTLFIDQTDCLGKLYFVMGWDMAVPLSIHELAPLLSAYGNAIFIKQHNDIGNLKSNRLPQLMKGSIGKYPIAFILRDDGNKNVSGIYAYTSKGLGIKVDGTLADGILNLIEYDSNQNEIATIKGTLKHGTILGIWRHNKTTKQLPVRLSME